jgi:uncharacterized protein
MLSGSHRKGYQVYSRHRRDSAHVAEGLVVAEVKGRQETWHLAGGDLREGVAVVKGTCPSPSVDDSNNPTTEDLAMDGGFYRRDEALNVLGEPLLSCAEDEPVTGYYRDGSCATGPDDVGRHVVCARMTVEFLDFSLRQGNDLVTPHPEYDFPGLKPGDRWCLCAARWREALEAGCAPKVVLRSTHQRALDYVSLGDLKRHAIDLS